MEIIKERFSKLSGGKILDVGTGVGQFIKILINNLGSYDEITGIDNYEGGKENFNKKFPQENIQFVVMDAAKMSYEDETFDTVCISNSLHHLPNMNEVLKEMKRVLKPGGLFIISEMFCDDQNPKQMSHLYVHHLNAKINRCQGQCHNDTYEREAIIDIARAIDLKLLDVFDYKFPGETEPEDDDTKDIAASCDKLLEMAKELPNYEELACEGKRVKEYILNTGFASTTELMIVGSK